MGAVPGDKMEAGDGFLIPPAYQRILHLSLVIQSRPHAGILARIQNETSLK